MCSKKPRFTRLCYRLQTDLADAHDTEHGKNEGETLCQAEKGSEWRVVSSGLEGRASARLKNFGTTKGHITKDALRLIFSEGQRSHAAEKFRYLTTAPRTQHPALKLGSLGYSPSQTCNIASISIKSNLPSPNSLLLEQVGEYLFQ